ncbi:N-acetylglucosamine kinase [Actinokineospora iranica]|uniref:BadF-type ATPase n=1 Tax=Actinokineospora iranica TaxID=1271860 RepID=A0A1G6WLH5_9PSEU|nr:BadF/BadG/BcrA/BcrD ATPase family protein [Actinokineospora iranica]SDD65895.1 BadF-type ATPase [Actinokineospora iranica]
MRTVLAVDGGPGETDVALVREDGAVLGRGRGPGFAPRSVGVAAAVDVVARTARAALGSEPPFADHVAAYLAGADLPEQESAVREEFLRRGLGHTVDVGNDAFALLRAGTRAGWGVAVVCGAGVNAAGLGPDGRMARLPALGRVSGDWGGGQHLGEEVLWHAVRAEDGRGPATALVSLVRSHFGVARAVDVALAVHRGEIDPVRLADLAWPLLEMTDEVAENLVARLADEVCLLGCSIVDRLGLSGAAVEIVLGGGVLTGGSPSLMGAVAAGYAARVPLARVVVADRPPIVGAVRLGLDRVGAGAIAHERVLAAFD